MNSLHKEFTFFSWQHFNTQRGVVKISLQAISFYTMIYFRVYWKELGGKIHCHHTGRISLYFFMCQYGLIIFESFWSACVSLWGNTFAWNFLNSGLWGHRLISVNYLSMLAGPAGMPSWEILSQITWVDEKKRQILT